MLVQMQALYPSAQVGGEHGGIKTVTSTDPMPMGMPAMSGHETENLLTHYVTDANPVPITKADLSGDQRNM
jgi:hypothetical protein